MVKICVKKYILIAFFPHYFFLIREFLILKIFLIYHLKFQQIHPMKGSAIDILYFFFLKHLIIGDPLL